MEFIYINRDDIKRELIEVGMDEREKNILNHIYSIKLKHKDIEIIFIDREM